MEALPGPERYSERPWQGPDSRGVRFADEGPMSVVLPICLPVRTRGFFNILLEPCHTIDKPKGSQAANRVTDPIRDQFPTGVLNRRDCIDAQARLNTAATNTSCPASTPRLKNNKAVGIPCCGKPTSARAPANPNPCSRPNTNATNQGYRSVKVNSPEGLKYRRASSAARNRMSRQ